MDMQDSGQRQQFDTGAQRDTADSKPRPELISPFAEERLGEWLRRGAAKYDARNWEKGMPFSRCVASLQRHLIAFKKGEKDEDHVAAMLFNAMALAHYQEMVDRGVLSGDLDDMPDYGGSEQASEQPLEQHVQLGFDWPASPYYTDMYDRKAAMLLRLRQNGCSANTAYTIVGGMRSPGYTAGKTPQGCVYIAGPMRGRSQLNFPEFDRARELWLERGYYTISPADMDRADGHDYKICDTRYTPTDSPDRIKRDVYRDFQAIYALHPNSSDKVVFLPGWATSVGASAERALAHWLGIEVEDALEQPGQSG
jgi:hypothetical protein